jgi:Arc/MetJ-type ribon-helix-helix transcriptional regulator
MIRAQIQFTEEQLAALRAWAARQRVSVSEAVRRAVDAWLRAEPKPAPRELRERAMAAAGRFASGDADTAREHDRYLSDAYRS